MKIVKRLLSAVGLLRSEAGAGVRFPAVKKYVVTTDDGAVSFNDAYGKGVDLAEGSVSVFLTLPQRDFLAHVLGDSNVVESDDAEGVTLTDPAGKILCRDAEGRIVLRDSRLPGDSRVSVVEAIEWLQRLRAP